MAVEIHRQGRFGSVQGTKDAEKGREVEESTRVRARAWLTFTEASVRIKVKVPVP